MSGQRHAPAFSRGEEPQVYPLDRRLDAVSICLVTTLTELSGSYTCRRTLLKRKLFHVSNICFRKKRPNFIPKCNVINADSCIVCILNMQASIISKYNLIFRIM